MIRETTKGLKVECEKLKNKGEFTSQRLGTVEIDFENCKSEAVKCNTAGDPAGILLLTKPNTDIHLVDLLKGGKLLLGVAVILLKDVIIKCGVALTIEVLNSNGVLGVVDKLKNGELKDLEKVPGILLLFHQVKGEQEFKECDLTVEFCGKEGARKKFLLEAKFGSPAEELAGEDTNDTITFAKEVEFHF